MVKKDPGLPWMPWFPSDFLSSSRVMRMSLEEQGAYRRLLDFQWMDGCIPDDLDEIARLLVVDRPTCDRIWRRISGCFDPCDGGLRNERLHAERITTEERMAKASAAGRTGAAARWRLQCDRNATALPSTTTTTTTTEAPPPAEVCVEEKATGKSSNGNGFHPKHPSCEALADYHARAVKHWKPDANVNQKSSRSLRAFDALLLSDSRDFEHTKEILAWIFRGQPGDYAPRDDFDWRPNLLSGDSVRRAWDKLDILFKKALEPNEQSTRRF